MGIEAAPKTIWTSAHATIDYLRAKLPGTQRLFIFGTPGLHEEFRDAGFEIVDERPDAVIVGFDTSLTFERLAKTAHWIAQGLPYIATHPDRVCPTDRPIVLPDCGAICALFEAATGRRPDAVPGKPNRAMLEAVMKNHNLAHRDVAMVGDRLYTDVQMARDAGVFSILSLTGETKRADAEACCASQRPDLVVADLGELARLIEKGRDVR
jgi:NagD protein